MIGAVGSQSDAEPQSVSVRVVGLESECARVYASRAGSQSSAAYAASPRSTAAAAVSVASDLRFGAIEELVCGLKRHDKSEAKR